MIKVGVSCRLASFLLTTVAIFPNAQSARAASACIANTFISNIPGLDDDARAATFSGAFNDQDGNPASVSIVGGQVTINESVVVIKDRSNTSPLVIVVDPNDPTPTGFVTLSANRLGSGPASLITRVEADNGNRSSTASVNSTPTSTNPPTLTGGGVTGTSSGPVTLASVDVSNSQADDLIRQRRAVAQQQTEAEPVQTAAAVDEPEATATAPETDNQPGQAKKSAKKKSPKKTQAAVATAKAAQADTVFDMDPQFQAVKSADRGLWAQVFADYERHRNLAPGQSDNPTRHQRTIGQISGADTSWKRYSGFGEETVQFGLLGGYSETKSDFTDTPNVTNAKIREDGGFVGAYGSYISGNFAADASVKVDFFDIDRSSVVRQTRAATIRQQTLQPCPDGQIRVVDSVADLTIPDQVVPGETMKTEQSGSVSETNYSIGGNLYYRFDLGDGVWIEPLVGTRFSYTDFGSGAASIDLEDGRSVRVQGGARIGTGWVDVNDRFWTVSLLGLFYSDVYIDGYSLDGSGIVSTASEVDEGELRALAQLSAQVDIGNGFSFLGQTDVRGGEDVLGVGGRLGVRYNW